MNRPLFKHELASWMEQPEVAAIVGGSDVRIADVCAGEGWSSVALARALPDASVLSMDVDAPSTATARRLAAEAGVAVEVRSEARRGGTGGVSPCRSRWSP